MPILALGPNGKIYQTSPDRSDGLGFGYAPECVDQQDVTLGSAYLKSQTKRRQELVKAYQQQRILDAKAAHDQRLAFLSQQRAKAVQAAEEAAYHNPAMNKALSAKALTMGCPCEYRTTLSGNVMTANGQSGWRGMSRDQQTIHHALTGMGHNTAYRPDPMEVRQQQIMKAAENRLRLGARR